MLAENVGKRVKLRPRAIRLLHTGEVLPPEDDLWLVEDVSERSVRLRNLRTHHVPELGLDHIREYMTDPELGAGGFLLLKSQAFISGPRFWVEPIPNPW